MSKDKKISSLGQDVLKAIKSKKIKPEPKWKFILRNYFLWSISSLSMLIGAFAFSVIIYMLKNNDWDVYENINDSLLGFILLTLPYFWIVFLIIFVFVADYNLKHTKKGYRYRVHFLTLVSVAVSMFLGFFLYNFGVGRAIDDAFAERIPLYRQSVNKMHQRGMFWNRPNDGFLSGVVISIENENNFKINDIRDVVWQIEASEAEMFLISELLVDHGVRIYGEKIEILSETENLERKFRALKVLPLPNKSWFDHNDKLRKDLKNRLLDPVFRDKLRSDINRGAREIVENEMLKVGTKCSDSSSCQLPFNYAIQSNCPYEAQCLNNYCKVVCSMPYKRAEEEQSGDIQCEIDADCDCSYFAGENDFPCICNKNHCLSIVVE